MKSASDIISVLEGVSGVDPEHAIAIMGGSDVIYEKMLRQVISRIPSNLTKLEKYLAEEEDLTLFSVRVHGMKGSFRQVGCMRMAKLCETFETEAKADNRPYCTRQFGELKKELMEFYERILSILKDFGVEADAKYEDTRDDNIKYYIDVLERARAAADDYDSIAASEILSQLKGLRFGGNTDVLLTKAMEALEIFETQEALEHISKLIDICEGRSR